MLSCEAIREELERRLGAETGERGSMQPAFCESFRAIKNGVTADVSVGRQSVTVWVDREDVYRLAGAPRHGLSDMSVRLDGCEACLESRTRGPRPRDYRMSWTLESKFLSDDEMLDRLTAFLSAVFGSA